MRGRGIGADVPRTVSELLWKLCTQGSIKGEEQQRGIHWSETPQGGGGGGGERGGEVER